MENKIKFRRFGTMIDCSRNAVMNVTSVKKWIDITSDLGYNSLLLYTEDTYEVDNQPYFGYMRGRYSKNELKELDAYAKSKGIELIPCIQTLAHIYSLKRWRPYTPLFDIDDVLLIGDEKVYELIEDMFKTVSECFTSRIINVGMDEADNMCRGKYYDVNGNCDRAEAFIKHVNRVAEIGKKYGFTITIWSDMLYHLVTGKGYREISTDNYDDTYKNQMPDNVELVYWNYHYKEKEHYDAMFKTHLEFCDKVWFAGVLYGGHFGFGAHNTFTMQVTEAGLESCIDCGVEDVILTMWGDDGAEGSKFALLPSLFYASEIAKGNTDKENIKQKFKEKYGIDFDAFLAVDILEKPEDPGVRNPEKYLLYNDLFLGLLDTTLVGTENEEFAECVKKLEVLKDDKNWGYIFSNLYNLCDAMTIKADLGQRTRKIYNSRDMEQLDGLIDDYTKFLEKLNLFYYSFRKQWYIENKPNGFEIQDIRIGGLIKRTENCRDWLIAFRNGEISVIDELEEKQLDPYGYGENFVVKGRLAFNRWDANVSVNGLAVELYRKY